MLLNAFNFALFLPIVSMLYWFATKGNLRGQTILLLVAGYFFYACWNGRFLILLIFSALPDYFTTIKMYEGKPGGNKSGWFGLSIDTNVGFPGFFKYFFYKLILY